MITVGAIFINGRNHKINVNLPSVWGSMQDLPSWSFNDHENVRNQLRTTREDLVNDLKAAGTIVTKKTICNSLRSWKTEILQHPQGPLAQESTCLKLANYSEENWVKVLWSDETKIQLFVINSIAVFGGKGMLPVNPKNTIPPSNMEVETCLGVFFLSSRWIKFKPRMVY